MSKLPNPKLNYVVQAWLFHIFRTDFLDVKFHIQKKIKVMSEEDKAAITAAKKDPKSILMVAPKSSSEVPMERVFHGQVSKIQ